MAHRFRKVGVAAVGVVAVILVAVALLSEKSPPASAPLPNPNGYDDFVRAGAMMDQRDYSAFPSLEKDGLASLVASNEEALAAARIGFTHACAVRGSALSLSPGSTSDMMVMKQIAQLFAAEGRLAEMEDRPADAARSYIDAVRLGNESSRGGLLIHRLVGVACQAIGLKRLAQVVPALNCDQSRAAIAGLARIDGASVSWDEISRNERTFMRHQVSSYRNPIRLAVDWWSGRKQLKQARSRHDRVVACTRLILTELAIRCYKAEQGHPPATLNDLVPKYLQSVPMDPFTPKPLVYRPQGTNWVLYSVGPDGQDNGGKASPGGSASAPGDLSYDSAW